MLCTVEEGLQHPEYSALLKNGEITFAAWGPPVRAGQQLRASSTKKGGRAGGCSLPGGFLSALGARHVRPCGKRWDQHTRADPLTRTRRFGTGVTEGGDKHGFRVAPLTKRPRGIPAGVISLSRCSLGSGARGGAAPPGGDWRPRQSPPLFGVTGRGGGGARRGRAQPMGGAGPAAGRAGCAPYWCRVPSFWRTALLIGRRRARCRASAA